MDSYHVIRNQRKISCWWHVIFQSGNKSLRNHSKVETLSKFLDHEWKWVISKEKEKPKWNNGYLLYTYFRKPTSTTEHIVVHLISDILSNFYSALTTPISSCSLRLIFNGFLASISNINLILSYICLATLQCWLIIIKDS